MCGEGPQGQVIYIQFMPLEELSMRESPDNHRTFGSLVCLFPFV